MAGSPSIYGLRVAILLHPFSFARWQTKTAKRILFDFYLEESSPSRSIGYGLNRRSGTYKSHYIRTKVRSFSLISVRLSHASPA